MSRKIKFRLIFKLKTQISKFVREIIWMPCCTAIDDMSNAKFSELIVVFRVVGIYSNKIASQNIMNQLTTEIYPFVYQSSFCINRHFRKIFSNKLFNGCHVQLKRLFKSCCHIIFVWSGKYFIYYFDLKLFYKNKRIAFISIRKRRGQKFISFINIRLGSLLRETRIHLLLE